MAKKLIVQRNVRSFRGGSATRKYLLMTTAGFVLLFILTLFFLRDKGRETAGKMAVRETGAVTKAVPRQDLQPAPVNPASATTNPGTAPTPAPVATKPQAPAALPPAQPAAGPAQPQAQPTNSATVPAQRQETVSQPQPQPPEQPAPKLATSPQPPAQTAAQPASQPAGAPPVPAQQASAPAQGGPAPQVADKLLFPRKANRPEHAAAAPPEKPAPKAARKTKAKVCVTKSPLHKTAVKTKTAQSAKPAVVSTRNARNYAVQVGSVYKNIKQAEALRKKLAAKGYKTSIRRVACSGYLVVTVPSTRSNAYTQRAQLNASGLKNTKVVGTAPAVKKAGSE